MDMRWSAMAWVVVAMVGWVRPAGAVIAIQTTVSDLYEKISSQVVVGRVGGIKGNVVDCEIVEVARGPALAGVMRIQVVNPAELLGRVKAGDPTVVFVGKARGGAAAAIHLADTWLTAAAVANVQPAGWRIVQENPNFRTMFPGRTETLVRLVGDLKAGKANILNRAEEAHFGGGMKEVGKIGAAGAALLAAHRDEAGKMYLLVRREQGVRLYAGADGALEDVTEARGLGGLTGSTGALGDVNGDGQVDVLAGGELWISGGNQRLERAAKLGAGEGAISMGIVDVNGDQRADAVAVMKDGTLRVALNGAAVWTLAPARSLWKGEAEGAAVGDYGDEGRAALVIREGKLERYSLTEEGPAQDFTRLVGQPLDAFLREESPLKGKRIGAIDADGNGRRDLLVLGPSSGLLLINRGYGTFFASLAAVKPLIGEGGGAVGGMTWAAVDVKGRKQQDLVGLGSDGRVVQVGNPPAGTP